MNTSKFVPSLYDQCRSFVWAVIVACIFAALALVYFVGSYAVAIWDTLVIGKSVEQQTGAAE